MEDGSVKRGNNTSLFPCNKPKNNLTFLMNETNKILGKYSVYCLTRRASILSEQARVRLVSKVKQAVQPQVSRTVVKSRKIDGGTFQRLWPHFGRVVQGTCPPFEPRRKICCRLCTRRRKYCEKFTSRQRSGCLRYGMKRKRCWKLRTA